MLQELNNRFGGHGLTFVAGNGNFINAHIENPQAAATISLYGAQVLQFQPTGGKPVLWVSDYSRFEEGKAIRGGIPVCAPWFGAHPSDRTLPSHGVARIRHWQVKAAGLRENGDNYLTLSLAASDSCCGNYPGIFDFELNVEVGSHLKLELRTVNRTAAAQPFSAALHSYFAVGDISLVTVEGLNRAAYFASVTGPMERQSDGIRFYDNGKYTFDFSRFDREVDRVYLNTAADGEIVDALWRRRIVVAKHGSMSTVVWNPWQAKAAQMADFGDREYLNMLCVETANAKSDARILEPYAAHTFGLDISEER